MLLGIDIKLSTDSEGNEKDIKGKFTVETQGVNPNVPIRIDNGFTVGTNTVDICELKEVVDIVYSKFVEAAKGGN